MNIKHYPAPSRSGHIKRFGAAIGKRILAACEPIMAALYWPCLSARSELEDRRANTGSESWYLNSALRAGGKDER